jgi:hypothetical protein
VCATGLFWSRESDGSPRPCFRFYFFSREELRAHVHVQTADGEAKFWIEPTVEIFANCGLKSPQGTEAQKLVEEHIDAIRSAWAKHFPG